MKKLLFIVTLCTSLTAYGQQYTIGLQKMGTVIKNIEGELIVTDSTLTETIEGQTATYKITRRDGYTIHVTDGTNVGKFVITHPAGKLHGFTYDRQIIYHPEKRQAGTHWPVYYAKIQPRNKPE
jgi:hypothetical protein